MRAGPSIGTSPSGAAIWLTTPPTTVNRRPQGKAMTRTSSPSLVVSFRRAGVGSSPTTSMTARSRSGLTEAIAPRTEARCPGRRTKTVWPSTGSTKCLAVTIHARPDAGSTATTTPEAARRPPSSRSARNWTIEARIPRMRSLLSGAARADAHPVAASPSERTASARLMRRGPGGLVAGQLAVPTPVRLLDVLEDDVDLVGCGLADLHHRLGDGGRELPLLVLRASRVPLDRDVGHGRRLLI